MDATKVSNLNKGGSAARKKTRVFSRVLVYESFFIEVYRNVRY